MTPEILTYIEGKKRLEELRQEIDFLNFFFFLISFGDSYAIAQYQELPLSQ